MKTCFKCGIEKPFNDFYAHPKMSDGHLGKCKECTKADVRENYRNRIDQYQRYEKERQCRDSRRKMKLGYQKEYRERYPDKYYARSALQYAVKSGAIEKKSHCEWCGGDDTVQAHHPDHSKPVEVV